MNTHRSHPATGFQWDCEDCNPEIKEMEMEYSNVRSSIEKKQDEHGWECDCSPICNSDWRVNFWADKIKGGYVCRCWEICCERMAK